VTDLQENNRGIRCADIESLAILYVCDELDAAARAELEAHLGQCPACADVVAREARLHKAIASLDRPADSLDRSGLLLAQCRSELAEAIDDQQGRVNRPAWRAIISPVAWWTGLRNTLVYHPAMSMAALVVVGFLAGVLGQRMGVAPIVVVPPGPPTLSASAKQDKPDKPKLTEQQLRSADSARVAWVTPSGSRTPTVQVELMSPTPMNLVGAPDDVEIERALTFVLQNGERFDSGARLDSLDVLRTCADDYEVRRALCAAARMDRDPDVRLKALKALQGFERDPSVRGTLLDALQTDENSGVRSAAIGQILDALRARNESITPEPQTLYVLRDRLRNDPSRSVRLQSAAALRELGAQ
jgi:anti-sigma factor RsiW